MEDTEQEGGEWAREWRRDWDVPPGPQNRGRLFFDYILGFKAFLNLKRESII